MKRKSILSLFVFLVGSVSLSLGVLEEKPVMHAQSPINLKNANELDIVDTSIPYKPAPYAVIHKEHTIEVEPGKQPFVVIDKENYGLAQFHFHIPSEHLIRDKKFDMEMHFVHKNQKDPNKLAVIGVLIKEGPENESLNKIIDVIPQEVGEEKKQGLENLELADLFPKGPVKMYRYTGSLTTPPYTEGVKWLIVKKWITASKEQIGAFKYFIKHANAREVQPLYGRAIVVDIA